MKIRVFSIRQVFIVLLLRYIFNLSENPLRVSKSLSMRRMFLSLLALEAFCTSIDPPRNQLIAFMYIYMYMKFNLISSYMHFPRAVSQFSEFALKRSRCSVCFDYIVYYMIIRFVWITFKVAICC